MAEQNKTRTIILALVLAAVAAGGFLYMRLSSTESTPPTTSPRQVSTQPQKETPKPANDAVQAAAPAPAKKEILPSDNPPLTLTALKHMPESAQAALGIPPVSSLIANVAPFVQLLTGDEMDVTAELEAIAHDLAKDMGVDDSADLSAVIDAMGLNSKQGPAVFVNLSDVFQDLMSKALVEKDFNAMPDMSAMKAVVVVPITDKEKAKASLEKLTKDMLSGATAAEEQAEGLTLQIFENIGAYFMTDNMLALSNDVDMLKETAARVAAPAQFQYGSASCPAEDIHEAAILLQGKKFIPLLEDGLKLLADQTPAFASLYDAQLENSLKIYENSSMDDPLIMTMSVRQDAVEIKSKMDASVYPELLSSWGKAEPLRWTPRLPQNTQAFLTFCLSPEFKTQIQDTYLPAIPEEVRNQPGVSQGMMYSKTAMEMLGREMVIGMTDLEPLDFPSLYLMIELDNPVAAQMLLNMAPQSPHGDPYRDIQIKIINFPSPIQLYFALVDNAVVVSNNDVGIQKIIDLFKDSGDTGFFSSLAPPIDANTPIYTALLVKPSVYGDIINPLASLSGRNFPKEVGDIFDTLASLFNDVRLVSKLEGDWFVSQMLVSRKQ